MSQKVKMLILVVIILLVMMVVGVYFIKKNKAIAPTKESATSSEEITQTAKEYQAAQSQIAQSQAAQPQTDIEAIIDGKVRSINDKQVYIELADGKGNAINIVSTTPVRTESDNKVGNLSLLKEGVVISARVDKDNNAIEILVKK